MRLIERLLLLHMVGCRLIQPGFSKQGTSGGIPFETNEHQHETQASECPEPTHDARAIRSRFVLVNRNRLL
jgi:hypothetical protein